MLGGLTLGRCNLGDREGWVHPLSWGDFEHPRKPWVWVGLELEVRYSNCFILMI